MSMSQVPIPAGLSGGDANRIGNEMIRAKQAAFGGNAAALNSLRQLRTGPHVRPKSQVSGYQESPQQLPTMPPVQQSPQVVQTQPNTGAASAPQVSQPEDPIERYNRNQALDKIISSPEMMDTVTTLKLRNHFKGRPDDGIGAEALSRIRGVSG
jgi:hypothetical protein